MNFYAVALPPPSQPRENSMLIVPPGGFAGFAQQTPATQALFNRATGTTRRKTARRRKAKTAKVARRKTRRTAARRGKARLVKGSRAAKAYMAKIRRKRKK